MNKIGVYIVGGLVAAGAIVGGAVVMRGRGGSVSVPGASALAASLTPPRQKALRGELRQIGADQRARAAQVARIGSDPRVQKSKRLAPIVKRLSQKQAETALVLERTDRYLAAADPRVAAYERQLGMDLAELDRLAHILDVAAQRERIVSRPAPAYAQAAPRPMAGGMPAAAVAQRPAPAGRPGAAVGLGPSIVALDRSYDNSRNAYAAFHGDYRQTVRAVPQEAFPRVDVRREIATMPKNEVYYAMGHYLAPSAHEVAYYATAMNIQAPTYQEVNQYASLDVYQQNNVQQNNVIEGDTNITINLDNSVNVDNSDNALKVDNSIALLEQEYQIKGEEPTVEQAMEERPAGDQPVEDTREANLYGGGGGAAEPGPAADPNPAAYADPGPGGPEPGGYGGAGAGDPGGGGADPGPDPGAGGGGGGGEPEPAGDPQQ